MSSGDPTDTTESNKRPLELAKWVILIVVITVVVVLTLLSLQLSNMFSTIVGTI